MNEFNRERVVEAISNIQLSRRLVLAATSTERLMPFYESYWASQAADRSFFRTVLDKVWDHLFGADSNLSSVQLDELFDELKERIPDEDDLLQHDIYAQDAAIAVTYTIDTWRTSAPLSAAFCLEQAYNVTYDYVLRQILPDGIVSEQLAANVDQDPIVQAELARQLHEIELCQCIEEDEWLSVVRQVRAEAIQTRLIPSLEIPRAD